jgi:two-component system LytT family response regulator
LKWIEAANYYAVIHLGGKTFTLRQTIKSLPVSLDPKRFLRIHRSCIVNIDYVREIIREGWTDGWVVLLSGQRLRMSKFGWQSLLEATDSSATKPDPSST